MPAGFLTSGQPCHGYQQPINVGEKKSNFEANGHHVHLMHTVLDLESVYAQWKNLKKKKRTTVSYVVDCGI